MPIRRPLASAALLLLIGAPAARAGDHEAGAVPPNAVIPPGMNLHQPDVEPAQAIRIVREGLHATFAALARTPVRATATLGARGAERLAIRAREIALIGKPGCPIHRAGPCTCRPVDWEDPGGGVGGPPTAARLTYLPDSEPAVRALLALISGARSRIDFMIYGWEDDPTGREVAAALAARARAGVRIRLLVDRTGFLIHNPAAARGEQTFLDALAATPNVALIEPPGTYLRFDHRKLAVVDGRIAWTGGMILTDYARHSWHNFAFLAEGPIVAQYATLFAERWQEQGGAPAGPEPPPPPVAANAAVRLLRTDLGGERSLKGAIYHAVDHARRHIYLENPYFSDEILSRKLAAAAARGVDVRAVLTLRNNVARMARFETLVANRLLRDGGHVYLYPKMTHVKALSVDGVWAYIGTGNFDELSLRNNREAGLAVGTPSAVDALDRALFHPDMAASQRLEGPLPPPSMRERVRLFLLALWY